MQPWNIVGGPRKYDDERGGGEDIDIGWAWDIGRGGDRRIVHVEVAGGRLEQSDLPDECARAIRDQGRSAIEMHVDEDVPPTRIVVTSGGLMVERG